jgi:hypothetical protein
MFNFIVRGAASRAGWKIIYRDAKGKQRSSILTATKFAEYLETTGDIDFASKS